MSNRNFDASVITRRRGQQNIATNIYMNMQNGTRIISQPTSSDFNTSILPELKTGHTTTYSKNGLVTTVSPGGPLYGPIINN